jgi:3-hydroxyisobutyrate dehydrogenase
MPTSWSPAFQPLARSRRCSGGPTACSRVYARGPCFSTAVGAGHAVKAVNALLAVNLLAVGQGLAALVKAGVRARTAVDVFNASSGRSFVTEVLVGIARAFAREAGVDASVLDLAGTLLSSARAALGEEADHVEAIRLIEREAGVEIRG